MKLVNLTPHEITIHPAEGDPIVLPPPPKGEEVRLEGGPTPPSKIIVGGVSIRVSFPIEYDRVVGLPPLPEAGVGYIVSAMVGEAKSLIPRQFMGHIFSPDSGKDAIRKDGQIVGVRGVILRY